MILIPKCSEILFAKIQNKTIIYTGVCTLHQCMQSDHCQDYVIKDPQRTLRFISQAIHIKFANTFFKKLFLGNTRLSDYLKIIMEQNRLVEGLKDKECKKGANPKCLPLRACLSWTRYKQSSPSKDQHSLSS